MEPPEPTECAKCGSDDICVTVPGLVVVCVACDAAGTLDGAKWAWIDGPDRRAANQQLADDRYGSPLDGAWE